MNLVRTWLLPAALAAVQLLSWPGMPALEGAQPPALHTAVALGWVGVVTLALGWRRRAPLPALAVLSVGQLLGLLVVPTDANLIFTVAELVALYSVAVRHPGRTAWLALAATSGWGLLLHLGRGTGLPVAGVTPWASAVGEALLAALTYVIAVELGRSRRRWLTGRSRVADRLVAAEEELRRAGVQERHRLARELHDVSAHHLTSIVVTVGAAERLADRQPALVAEAVSFAAGTSRDTLTALRRLVAVMREDDQDTDRPLATRLAELAGGFHRLGQPVTLELVDTDLPADLADAVHAITREALTNVLRHSQGAQVLVRLAVEGETVTLEITDDGAAVASAATLGAGRGVAGMAERATALGGALTAGPAGAGWRVRARLPATGSGVTPAGVGAGRRWRPSRLTVGVTAVAVALPLAVAVVSTEAEPALVGLTEPGAFALLALLCVLHAAPLLWRLDRPWLALAGVLSTLTLWPVAAALGGLPSDAVLVLLLAGVAEGAAVYAVGAHADRPALSWLSAPLAAGLFSGALIATAGADGSIAGEAAPSPFMFLMGLIFAVPLAVPMLLAWAAGATVRGRRTAVLNREGSALAAAAARSVAAAAAERYRVAEGLRVAVLDRAGRLVQVAEAGDPTRILVEARATLAAMRGLLDDLRPSEQAQSGAPQPTAAGIGALCAARDTPGRRVTFEGPTTLAPLPVALDTSAYRLVEAALDAGTADLRVRLRVGVEEVRVSVEGATLDPLTLAALRARVDALGGRLRLDREGLDARLPVPFPTADPPAQPTGVPG